MTVQVSPNTISENHIHNLAFYLDLVKVAREHILAGDFYEWKNSVVPILRQRL
jgi:queuine tRNA-ribosyltransferase